MKIELFQVLKWASFKFDIPDRKLQEVVDEYAKRGYEITLDHVRKYILENITEPVEIKLKYDSNYGWFQKYFKPGSVETNYIEVESQDFSDPDDDLPDLYYNDDQFGDIDPEVIMDIVFGEKK